MVWKAYFKRFHSQLNEKLPALIPQVYLHYDPYTLNQLGSEKRLFRQRMDFLLLLSERTRVVIEVDGKQHYADGNIANPRRYAEMVAEDRKLQLAGYEVYRFGAFELQLENAEDIVQRFFQGLFQRHEIRSDPA
jgi:very-short-patch-repair endonuclease